MINEYKDVSLRALNTLGIEVRCERLVEFSDAGDLPKIFMRPEIAGGRWAVLGGGSNILFTGDFCGTLLRPVGHAIDIVADDGTEATVRAEAGAVWDDFVAWTVERGLWGAENLSHIPGTVGAAPVQNIGAYGVEAKDIIHSVEMYDAVTGKMVTLPGGHCDFGYRDSVFKRLLKGRVVITAVFFTLGRAARPQLDYGDLRAYVEELGGATLANIRTAVVAIRRSKLPEPSETGNAGSFFKNPTVSAATVEGLLAAYPDMPVYPAADDGFRKSAAGWLIDRCGWKGRSLGRAGVHARQALVLVNLGGATGGEILTLAGQIAADVRAKFGVELEPEVNVW